MIHKEKLPDIIKSIMREGTNKRSFIFNRRVTVIVDAFGLTWRIDEYDTKHPKLSTVENVSKS